MENEQEQFAENNVPVKQEETETPSAAEKLFPFVRKARVLILGRETLERSKSRLQFLLITTDISENSKSAMLRDYAHYPIVQHYSSADLKKHFGCTACKVIGFEKGGLAKSIYQVLKQFRINKPESGSNSEKKPSASRLGIS